MIRYHFRNCMIKLKTDELLAQYEPFINDLVVMNGSGKNRAEPQSRY